MITSASTINFGGCYDSVLQAGDAITFGGERTSLSGNIGTAPGTSITAYWKGTHTAGSAHYADTYSTTCATDMISIANEASAGLPSCTSIVPELGTADYWLLLRCIILT